VNLPYARPTDPDAPLDAIEQAVVRFWIDVLSARIRAKLASGEPLGEHQAAAQQPADATQEAPASTTD